MPRQLLTEKESLYNYYFINDAKALPKVRKDSVVDIVLKRFMDNPNPIMAAKIIEELRLSNRCYPILLDLKSRGVLGRKNNQYFPLRKIRLVDEKEYNEEVGK